MQEIATRLKGFEESIWPLINELSVKNQAVNLGQGFPAFPLPQFVKQALINSVTNDENQYSRSSGHPKLVQAISEVYSKKLRRTVDPMSEICVAMGASEALLLAIVGTLNPGDEMIIFEPFFDIYRAQVSLAGGVSKYVPLNDSTWTINYEALEASISDRTRLLMFNNPHNPTGKLYSHEEVEELATFLQKYPQIMVISDEVYEEHNYSGQPMARIVNLLWGRCVSIHSAGKLFSCTGWKIGWGIGSPEIIRRMQVMKMWTSFWTNTPCQAAVAEVLHQAEEPYLDHKTYYEWLRSDFKTRLLSLDSAIQRFSKIQVTGTSPDSGYFYFCRFDPAQVPQRYLDSSPDTSFAFVKWMAEEFKVTAIPGAAFFSPEHVVLGGQWVRFAFCKNLEDFEEARRRLSEEAIQ